MRDYESIARQAPNRDARSVIAYLDQTLPSLWKTDYEVGAMTRRNLLVVTFGDEAPGKPFCRYLFDHASEDCGSDPPLVDDRVVAVWGISQQEPSKSRDRNRMRGFLRGIWSKTYPGADRGHFFAHTLGGGTDINLFPQSMNVNRAGLWRRMEVYCSTHPGTFCFVRPIYTDESWIPRYLEYGIFKTTSSNPTGFWGQVFSNEMPPR